jgi:hypothetical protein
VPLHKWHGLAGNAESEQTGEGPNWFEQNLPEIKKRADEGDEEMLDLLEEMRTRDVKK